MSQHDGSNGATIYRLGIRFEPVICSVLTTYWQSTKFKSQHIGGGLDMDVEGVGEKRGCNPCGNSVTVIKVGVDTSIVKHQDYGFVIHKQSHSTIGQEAKKAMPFAVLSDPEAIH